MKIPHSLAYSAGIASATKAGLRGAQMNFMQYSFNGKKITVMGLGLHGGGVGVVKFLLDEGAREIVVTDLKKRSALLPSIRQIPKSPRLHYVFGRHRMSDFKHRDAVIKNPDVPLSSPYLAQAIKNGVPVLSDIGIFLERVKAPIIGVTGTKGKSTTATLIALLLQKRFPRILLAGNIRKSVLTTMKLAKRADAIVLELSSFQLDDLAYAKKSPHLAVITSIFPDHLNRHGTFGEYARAKSLITAFQNKNDAVIILKNRGLEPLIKNSKAKKIIVNISERDRGRIASSHPALRGHMADAAMLALAAAKFFGIEQKEGMARLKRFRPLAGRMQIVAENSGVTFINDTTATNPTAALFGLKLAAGRFRRVILIAGGSDKGLPADQFAKAIRELAHHVILLSGSATEKLKRSIGLWGRNRVTSAASMEEAVRQAQRRASRGDAVLLSPGAASFGLFLHEFHRGDAFVRAVARLIRLK